MGSNISKTKDEEKEDINTKDQHGETLLYKAAEAGDVNKCKELLQKGAKTEIADIRGLTPLFRAAVRGYVDVCQLLLEEGAKVDHVNNQGNCR